MSLRITMSLAPDTVWDYVEENAPESTINKLTVPMMYDEARVVLEHVRADGYLIGSPDQVYFDQGYIDQTCVGDLIFNLRDWETAQETLDRLDGVLSVTDLHEIADSWGDSLDEILVDRQIDAYIDYENAEKYGRKLINRMIDRKGFDPTVVEALYEAIDYQKFVGDILDRHNSYITEDGVLIAQQRDLRHLMM